MNRRTFVSSSSLAAVATVLTNSGAANAAGALAPEPQAAKPTAGPRKRALMKVGATARAVDDASLKALARYGVRNVVVNAPIAEQGRLFATVDELKAQREIARAQRRHHRRDDGAEPRLDPHRPREEPRDHAGREPAARPRHRVGADDDQELRRRGHPCIKYNMSILGVLRTGRTPGRGDTSYTSFKLADAKADPPLTRAGVVSRRHGTGSGSPTSSSASSPWPTSTRSGWRATRTTR